MNGAIAPPLTVVACWGTLDRWCASGGIVSVHLAHQKPFRLGSLDVCPAAREVYWAGGCEVLQPRVMQVLVALAQADGQVVGRDDLLDLCWDGRIVSEDAINFVVADDRVGFEVSVEAAERNALKISSRMLNVARRVVSR